jgi:membrane-associated phospholipid phosphatase
MLLATPLVGGHYFIDVFAGIALSMLAIAAAQRIGARSASALTRNRAQTPAVA